MFRALEYDTDHFRKVTFLCEPVKSGAHQYFVHGKLVGGNLLIFSVTLGCPHPEKPPTVILQPLISIAPNDILYPDIPVKFTQPYSPGFTPWQFARFVRAAIIQTEPLIINNPY